MNRMSDRREARGGRIVGGRGGGGILNRNGGEGKPQRGLGLVSELRGAIRGGISTATTAARDAKSK